MDIDPPAASATATAAATATATALRRACADCNLRELCFPVALDDADLDRLDALVGLKVRLRRGETLFRAGDRFESVYAVRLGFLKSGATHVDGREQITGFHMPGEMLGWDGIADEVHLCDAVALEDSQVCVIPFAQLGELAREVPGLQRHLHRILAREIAREQSMMMMLAGTRAEERVAAFLHNLLQRLRTRGQSSTALVLRMTREEIGSFLGLTLETVSRAFSKLQAEGVIAVRHRQVEVVDGAALERRVAGHGPGAPT